MKLKCRDIKKVCTVVAALFFLITMHIASVYLFAVHRFSIIADPALSSTGIKTIQSYLSDTQAYKTETMAQLSQNLKQQFGFIKTVCCRTLPNGAVEINIHADKPFMQLQGNSLILTAHNQLVNQDYYVPEQVTELPILATHMIEDETQLPQKMFAFLQSVDTNLLAGSTIQWKNRHDILFMPAQDELELVCNDKTKPTAELIAYCKQILAEQNTTHYGLRADARFDQQIIISKLTGRR